MCHCDGPEHPYDPSWCPPPRNAQPGVTWLATGNVQAAVVRGDDLIVNGVLYRVVR